MENLNANLIFCQNFDKESGNISGVFDTITLNDDKRQSFDIAMFFSGIECSLKQMIVYYLIYRVEEFKEERNNCVKILSKGTLRRVSGSQRTDGKSRECSFPEAFTSAIKIEIKNLKFTKPGVYEIRSYLFPYEEDTKHLNVEQILSKKEALLCFGSFEVIEKE